MKIRSIIFVIFISIIIGVIIFFLTDKYAPDAKKIKAPLLPRVFQSASPKATFKIDQNSNLEQELDKLTPLDYSQDFEKLRAEVDKF